MKHHSDPMVGGESEAEGKAWGRGKHANMPDQVKMKSYPKANQFGPGVLDDTMGGIDKANQKAHMKSRKYLSGQH